MAPKIRADRDAAKTGKKAAKARADAHFKDPKAEQKAAADKAEGETLKTTIAQLNLPALQDAAHHYKTVQGWKAKVDEMQGKYRNALKAAEEAGVDTSWIKSAMKWSKRDAHEFRRFLAGLQLVNKVAGIDVQFTLLDESGLDPIEKAFQDGHRAGLAGAGYNDNPHELGSAGAQRWEDGRQRGQKELAGQGIGKTTEPANDGDEGEGGEESEKDTFFKDLDNPAKAAASVPSPAADAARASGVAAH